MYEWIHRHLKLSHHRHSGRHLERRHTSYGVLLGLLIVAAAVVAFTARSAANLQTDIGQVNLQGTVQGPTPADVPAIASVHDGDILQAGKLNLSGSCSGDTTVYIYNNGVFIGSVACTLGSFHLPLQLSPGANKLSGKLSNLTGQFGPESAPITVYYTAPAVSVPVAGTTSRGYQTASPLRLVLFGYESPYVSSLQGEEVSMRFTLSGGVAPYAMAGQWGDLTTVVKPLTAAGEIELKHIYLTGGKYPFTLEVSDAAGTTYKLQMVILVSGYVPDAIAAGTTSDSNTVAPMLPFLWPVVWLCIMIVGTFWVGERREWYKLKRAHKLKAGARP